MKKDKRVLFLAAPLAVLLATVSVNGWLSPSAYRLESFNWQVQSRGQDLIDLFVVCPALLLSSLMASRNKEKYWPLWAGVNLYLVYTFSIYCFDIHFNPHFPTYCFILGLSFYSLLYGIYSGGITGESTSEAAVGPIQKIAAVFMLVTGAFFYFAWTSDIMQAIYHDETPRNVTDSGLFTNPVHVLDLSFFLPALVICGILILRGHRKALLFSPVLLVFMLLMDITIAFLTLYMKNKGLPGSTAIAVMMIMTGTASFWLLLRHYKGSSF